MHLGTMLAKRIRGGGSGAYAPPLLAPAEPLALATPVKARLWESINHLAFSKEPWFQGEFRACKATSEGEAGV